MAAAITNEELARRLDQIEQRLDQLARTVQQPEPNWLQSIRGILADEPEFAKVIEYGRAFRRSGHLADEGSSS